MKLSELKKDDVVTIRCKHKNLMADVKAQVADIRGEVVLLNLIRHEGQVVDFSSPNVQLITIYEDGLDMPKAWTNCKIQRRVVEGKQYHALAAPKPSVRINRRRVSRVVLNIPGKVNISTKPQGIDVIIHDLSANGIGIQSQTKIDEQELRRLQIEFTDPEEDEEEIKVEARVVWKKELGENQYFYGCRLTHMEENLGYYVADKMRKERE